MVHQPFREHQLRWPSGLLFSSLLLLGAELSIAQGPYHTGTTSWTLFRNSWPVLEIFKSNWSSTVHNADVAWGLDMYASWCGGCQRFAPIWKRLAAQMQGWRHVVRFGALPCSHPDGEQLCIDHGITHYPTIKLYPPRAAKSNLGTVYEGPHTEVAVRMAIVDFLSAISDLPPGYPNLRPVKSTVEILSNIEDPASRKILILAEEMKEEKTEENFLGRYVILDVSAKWPQVVIRRILSDDARNLGIRDFPSLHIVSPSDGSLSQIVREKTRSEFVDIIRTEVLGIVGDNGDEDEEGEQEYEHIRPSVATRIPDGVHDQDLESGLFHSLYREVASHHNIRGARLEALKTYIHHLAELLPVRDTVHGYLRNLDTWLSTQESSLTSTDWMKQLEDLHSDDAYLPKRVIWTGCLPVDPGKRGYPCSLWTIFHTLTITAFNNPNKGISSKDVVLGMRAYINRFFSCVECSKHFMKMSASVARDVDENDSSSGALWLWSAHNKVNQRLHGDPTEDRGSPKMQFPTFSKCRSCHMTKPRNKFVESEWDEDEVMDYLVGFYSSANLIRDTLPYTYIASVKVTKQGPDEKETNIVSRAAKTSVTICVLFTLLINYTFIMHYL